MKRYQGGETVAKGIYLNLSDWEYIQLFAEKNVLPASSRYLKVPAALAVLTGPLGGLVFIIFLPLVGIVGLVSFLGYKAWSGAVVLGRKAVQPVVIGWKPGRAYLTRKGGKERKPDAGGESETITEIEREIAKRRKQGEH